MRTTALAVLSRLSLQALCVYAGEDTERFRSEEGTAELQSTQPVDLAIDQWIPQQDRGQVPTGGRRYRVLRAAQAPFVLDGKMTGNVLVRDEGGRWSCWAIERNRQLDAS